MHSMHMQLHDLVVMVRWEKAYSLFAISVTTYLFLYPIGIVKLSLSSKVSR